MLLQPLQDRLAFGKSPVGPKVDQQQALITARELTSTALLFRLLVRYQPGGAGEKSILLAKLTALDKAAGLPELAATLRSWRRHYARAEEIGAVLPDGTLLLKALEPAVTQIAALDAQAAFRLAQSRLELGVDQQPHHAGVWRLFAGRGGDFDSVEHYAYNVLYTGEGETVGSSGETTRGYICRGQRQGRLHSSSPVSVLQIRRWLQGWQELQMVTCLGRH